MTPDTTAWDDFLRRFAEALGWGNEPHALQPNLRRFWWIPDRKQWVELHWLTEWPAVEYLIERARAEGMSLTINVWPDSCQVAIGVPLMSTLAVIKHDDLPKATAYAVAKALFQLQPPEGK